LFSLVLVVPLVVLALPLLMVSLFTRALARLLEPAHLTLEQLVEHDAKIGWKPRPNLDTHHLMVDLFHIRTDAQGWRGRATLEESEIVVFGDSFAAGYGVSDRHFFANLSHRPRIKPIGIGGYDLVQGLLWMRRLAPSLQGKVVVWFVYFGNDIHENLIPNLNAWRRPFVRPVNGGNEWEIVTSHVSQARWTVDVGSSLDDLSKLADLSSDSFFSRRSYRACEFLIRQAKEVCERANAKLIVMTIPDAHQLSEEGHRRMLAMGGDPDAFDPAYPDQQVEAICHRLGVGFRAGRAFLDVTHYKSNDCHWNEKGHRRIMEELSRVYATAQTTPVLGFEEELHPPVR
jgi:hypothetical protein